MSRPLKPLKPPKPPFTMCRSLIAVLEAIEADTDRIATALERLVTPPRKAVKFKVTISSEPLPPP